MLPCRKSLGEKAVIEKSLLTFKHEVAYYYYVHHFKNCRNALLNSDVKHLSKKPNGTRKRLEEH